MKKKDNLNVDIEQNKKEIETIEEEIPEKLSSPIREAQNKSIKVKREFNFISYKLAEIRKRHAELYSKIRTSEESIGNKIRRAFDKLKLRKKKNMTWSYDGKRSVFIGKPKKSPKISPIKKGDNK